ncbi:proline-rich protein 35 [Neosynchiropus ocellatus]
MSKDDSCKVMPAGKHKERKPKKPHYIPRPWGKPYNYKCFQCPFTCMEKSHLYNHMKYSLCKNSLSLLIESDWPYKKGNILHPEQLRPFQQGSAAHQTRKDEQGSEQRQREHRMTEEGGREDQEDQGAEEKAMGKQGDQVEKTGLPRARPNNGGSRDEGAEGNKKKTKQQESEQLMADMLSLEDQLLRARSVEVEAQLKHYKFSKTCLAAPGLLSEQWRLLASSHTKTRAESVQSRVNSSIPCYPPPANLVDYQDPTGLNLSLLGVGYPISPSIFSYMNSAIPGAASSVSAQTHAQLAQLPFLASAAQLMHPTSHTDRPLVPPRFYYPFLCEHTFGAASNLNDTKTTKATANNIESHHLSGFQPKVNLWKVPALRPGAVPGPQAGWVSPQTDSPDQIYKVEEKLPAVSKERLKRTGAPMGKQDVPSEKIPNIGFTLDILKNIQAASSMNPTPEIHSHHNSLQDSQLKTLGLWHDRLQASPKSEASTLSSIAGQSHQDSATARTIGAGASESVAGLLSDLSKALQEYQEAECKISHLEKEDLPAQHHLWEHLSKIRNELSHIHQALEQTTRQSDGPLDLSFKRELSDCQTEDSNLRDNMTETEEEEEPEEEKNEQEVEREREAMRASLETRKQSLDMLIKMSQASVVNGEVLSAGSLGMRPCPSEALWPNRTTKCEADSSVLLCPDGRSVVFTDIPKVPNRPPSIHRAEGQSPVSPLTAADG